MDSKYLVKAAALTTAFAAGAAAGHLYHRHLSSSSSSSPSSSSSNPASALHGAPSSDLAPTALLAAVELGGTSCRAAVAYARDATKLVAVHEVPTTDPQSTISELVSFLAEHAPFTSLGVASFGPIDLDRKSKTYGHITSTPKPGWQHHDLLSHFSHFRVPIGFDTDVNAPALAELRYNPLCSGGNSCAYVTVGTGIGVGVVVNGKPVHGLVHPEGGHIMPRKREGDTYDGAWTSVHSGASVESMASAKACAQRAKVDTTELQHLPDDSPIWDDVAYYLAQLCITICYMTSPHFIVLSGGVMKRAVLFDKIRKQFEILNEGYISHERVVKQLDRYIISSKYGNDIGIIGAIELARRAALHIE